MNNDDITKVKTAKYCAQQQWNSLFMARDYRRSLFNNNASSSFTNDAVKKMFSESMLSKMSQDTTFFYYQKDVAARGGQTFMFLIAPNRTMFYEFLKQKQYHESFFVFCPSSRNNKPS